MLDDQTNMYIDRYFYEIMLVLSMMTLLLVIAVNVLVDSRMVSCLLRE